MDDDRWSGPTVSVGSDEELPLGVIPLHSTNLLTVLDEDGVVRYESPSIETIHGFDQEDLIDEAVFEYVHPDDRATIIDAFRTVTSSDADVVECVEYRHEQADGSYKWVESVASADPTPGGYYVVNTRDVTERRERERRLERTNDRLEEFASIVSHDLRNPLNVAQSRLELAREESTSEHLGNVADAHERMASLIDEVLTLAHGDGSVERTEPVEIATVAEESWQSVATGDATLANEDSVTVRADRGHLRQLLENLFRNAVEHGSTSPRSSSTPEDAAGASSSEPSVAGAPEDAVEHGSTSPPSHAREDDVEHGGEDVTVLVGEVGARDGAAGFYVEDDGVGIPAADRDAIFEIGHSTSRDGMGLGLSIVEQVVEAHGWEISVSEGVDGGARFEITGVSAPS